MRWADVTLVTATQSDAISPINRYAQFTLMTCVYRGTTQNEMHDDVYGDGQKNL